MKSFILTLAAWTTLTVVAFAQPAEPPGRRAIQDLERTNDYVVLLDGEELTAAELYHSERELTWVLTAPELGRTLLVSPRGRTLLALDPEALTRGEDGTAELAAEAMVEDLGRYDEERGTISFTLDEGLVTLEPRPPLLGETMASEVEKRHPRFGRRARQHRPGPALEGLVARGRQVRVTVYFASWSPISERLVPKWMAVEEALHVGPRPVGLDFEYYGLSEPFDSDPIVLEKGLSGVPTVIVTIDGEEAGRVVGRELDTPVEALLRLLRQGN